MDRSAHNETTFSQADSLESHFMALGGISVANKDNIWSGLWIHADLFDYIPA